MADNTVFDEVDTTVRATLRGIGLRYAGNPEQGTFAVAALVPILCGIIDELGATVPPETRKVWAKGVYKTADKLAAS